MKKFLTLFAMLLFFGVSVFAQNHVMSGKVTDENGNPVSGASISVKGIAQGTSADEFGNFKIAVNKGGVLQISATNFAKTETIVGSGNEVTISLKPHENILQEVVVTALGQTTQKSKLGYSTATFNSEAINRTANINALDALAGKIAGAEISNTGGPGSSTKVILRGYGVIAGGSNQPLYVVDGIPLTDSRQGSSAIGLTTQNDFGNSAGDINPNNIASITVLKGTAASSLYGSAARIREYYRQHSL